MASQLAQFGDQALVNTLSGAATYTAAATGSAPGFKPGDVFYDTTVPTFKQWNGSNAWVVPPTGNFTAGSYLRYLALLTADPTAGTGAVNMTDPGFVECTTAGYTRMAVTFGNASGAYPSSATNTGVVSFPAFSATMLVPVNWVALVTVSSGTAGLFLASWVLAQPYLLATSQQIQVGIGQLTLQGN